MAEDNREVEIGVVGGEEVEGLVVVQVDNHEVQVDVVEVGDLSHLILWRVIGAGCMAIWPVIAPTLVHNCRRWGVAPPALPMERFLNPGIKAQEDMAKVGQFGSGSSMSYMARLGMSTQWTMQDNCTSPSDLNKL